MAELDFFLREVPFFYGLQAHDLKPILPLFRERRYKKGATIFLENDPGDEFFIIKSGMIKIYRFEDSREVILSIFREGDYFGEMAVLEEGEKRSATAETMEPSVLYVLKRNDFIGMLETQPKLSLKLLRTALNRLRKSNDLIKDLTTLDARSRIVKMIIRLSEKYGISSPEGIWIDVRLTHQQLADMTSTVRETVTKTLLELQNEGLIEVSRKQILIKDMSRLENRIHS